MVTFKPLMPLIVGVTAVALCPVSLRGQTAPPSQEQDIPAPRTPWAEPPELSELVGRTVLATGIVAALAVVSLLLMRHFLRPTRTGTTSDPNVLSLVASISLPQRAALFLVRARNTDILVALDPGGVKSVTVLPESFDEAAWQEGLQEHSELEPGGAAGG